MQPAPSVSSPSSTEQTARAGESRAGVARAIVRALLVAWAAAVFARYWLGYLGWR